MRPRFPRLDLFCRIIDNYGDIGVCWRLARQMHQAFEWEVRLWVDDLSVFQRLEPSLDPSRLSQSLQGVEVCLLGDQQDWESVVPHELVIEAFACELPPPFKQRLLEGTSLSLWLNLEYLSAESWVEGCHGLASRQSGQANKFFFFPGFTPHTGGLLREPKLLEERDRFQATRQSVRNWLATHGIPLAEHDRIVTLFGYPHGDYASLIRALDHPSHTVHFLQTAGLHTSLQVVSNKQHLHVLPFLSQTEFDQLLWCADLNVVRGEDSFVRAQWAGRPMLWHIYPQTDNAHLDKLQAWLDLSCPQQTRHPLHLGWNGAPNTSDWAAHLHHHWTHPQAWTQWQQHSQAWAKHLASLPELAASIHAFYHEQQLA